MPRLKSEKDAMLEGRAAADSHGLLLCEKSNEDSLKELTFIIENQTKDNELIEIAEDIHEIKSIVRKKENNSEALEKKRKKKVQIQDLRMKFEEFWD